MGRDWEEQRKEKLLLGYKIKRREDGVKVQRCQQPECESTDGLHCLLPVVKAWL